MMQKQAALSRSPAQSPNGRIFHCPEFGRVVIDFRGIYLVLRVREFEQLREQFRSLRECGRLRSRIEGGERIRLRDAVDGTVLLLGLQEIEDLWELMGSCVFGEISKDQAGWRAAADPSFSPGPSRGRGR